MTNRFLDLIPVVQGLADAEGMHAVLVDDDGEDSIASTSDWVLLSDDASALEAPQIAEASESIDARPDLRLWTDDFNNIVQIMK